MTEIIVTSSVLILLLAVLRRVLRGRISPWVQYGLWLLVAARLLIPGTLFTSPVSVAGAAAELESSVRQSFTETFPDPYAPNSPSAVNPGGQLLERPVPETGSVDLTESRFPEFDMQDLESRNWLDIIWKTGIAVTGGGMVLSNLVFYFRLRRRRKRLALPAAPWSGRLPVYEADGLPSPCLFGLFRPAIYLNESAMDAEHPEHVLAHEYAHYRHGDHVWAVLRCVCLAVHWYNPLVWWAAAMSRQDCELACDAAALRRLGENERIDYGQTLLRMVSRGRNPSALLRTATTMTAGKRAMKERIALIIKQPRMRKATLAAVLLLACLLAACSFGGKSEKAETDPSSGPGENIPAAVWVSQVYSSQSTDSSYITDPAEVERLWELYQSFEYEGSYDPAGMGGWDVSVAFRNSEGEDMAFFLLNQHGIYTQDGESLLLKDIDRIYTEFLRLSRSTDTSITPVDLDPTREIMANNAKSIVEQIQSGADVNEWLPLMNYMDWGVLARAAVEAGLDEGDGSMALVDNIMWPISQYIERQGASMTQAEYLYILSATAGLDGASAEGYGSMIYRLYTANPSQFAYVVLEMLPETQRNEALYLFCFEWYYHRVSDSPELPTREEAIAQLEADLEAGISASPGKEILYNPGSTFQFQLVNGSGIYALTYISSDTGVAEVDENGVVTAVGPGEAVITMHYEGAGGSLDFECQVVCQWDGTPAPQPAASPAEPQDGNSIRYDDEYETSYARYSDETAQFDQWFQGWMDGVSAAPDGAVSYDRTDERSLYQAVSQYLRSYAGDYFGDDFAQNAEDYDVQVYFAVPTDPGDQFTVSYSIHVAAVLVLPDGHIYSPTLDSRELQTVITPVSTI